jgi:hypothetical protein
MMTEAQTKAMQKLAARKREKAAAGQPNPKPWKERRHKVELFQDPASGEWFQKFASGGAPLPATDSMVSLWLDLQDARRMIEQLREKQP